MKYCRNCGAPLDDDALFCRECGNKVDVAPPVMTPPVVPPPVIPQPAAPQSVAPQSVGAQPVVPPVMPQPQVTETFTHDENETFIEVEPDYKLYYIIGGVVAAVLLAVGGWWFYTHHNGNNPLGVEKPKWEKFVMVNAEGVNLYKEADMSSPCLQYAVEQIDACIPDMKMLWQGDKAPRGYEVNDYNVESKTVYPVIDESDSWYKVHIGTGEIREAYLQKKYCEEVKPKPITKEIINKMTNDELSYRFVEKGEFANLVIRHEAQEIDNRENLMLGVLTDGCVVMPIQSTCYPQRTDTTGVAISNVSDSPEYNNWELVTPESYWKETTNAYSSFAFDLNKLTDDDIRKIVMALRTSGSTDTKVLYYFPDVREDSFVEFEYSFSPAKTTEVEEDKLVLRYDSDGRTLKAEIDGVMITAMSFDDEISVSHQFDLDGDGSMECIVTERCGNMEPVPYVVTYDADEGKFIKTEKFEYLSTPEFEEKDGKTTMVVRRGLHWIRYDMENHSLRKMEDKMKSYGTVRATLEVDNVYADDESGDINVKFDFDGDGNDDNLALYRGLIHAEGYGSYMTFKTVELADGTSRDIDLRAAKFSFLNSRTYGMPDIIGDDFLYRWDGSQYESYGWDGKNIVRENEL